MIGLDALPRPAAQARDLVTRIIGAQTQCDVPFFADLEQDPEAHILRFAVCPKRAMPQAFQSARLRTAQFDVTVYVPQLLLEYLCDISLVGWREEDPGALGWDICVTYVLSRLVQIGQPDIATVEICDVQKAASPPDTAMASVFFAQCVLWDHPHDLAVEVHHCDLQWIMAKMGHAGLLDAQPALLDPGFAFSMAFEVPQFDIGTLERVCVGSLLTFGQTSDTGCTVICDMPGIARFGAVFDGPRRLTVTQVLRKRMFAMSDLHDTENDVYEQSEPQDGPDGDMDAPIAPAFNGMSDLAALPVTLELSFPKQTMSLDALSMLGVGSSLEVNCTLDDALLIRANGQVVGQGHLIDLDGVLGLKVVAWTIEPNRHVSAAAPDVPVEAPEAVEEQAEEDMALDHQQAAI